MKKYVLGIVGVVVLGSVYYSFLYPPHLLYKETQKALEAFAEAVRSQDRAKVGDVLRAHIADDAAIHMEVNIFSLTQNSAKPMSSDFTKQSFLTFMDNVLYPLEHYEYQPELTEFTLNKARDGADVQFTSREWADGHNHYAGVEVGMRFSSETECSGHVLFVQKVPMIDKANCQVAMRMVPKPEEAYKLQSNSEAMQQFLAR